MTCSEDAGDRLVGQRPGVAGDEPREHLRLTVRAIRPAHPLPALSVPIALACDARSFSRARMS